MNFSTIPKKIWEKIKNNEKQLIVILTLMLLIAGGIIGYYQIKINIKALDLEGYAELFAYPDLNNHGKIIFVNTGSRSLYIQTYLINEVEQSPQNESLIPPSIAGSYRIDVGSENSTMNIQVFYRDVNDNNYRTDITAFYNEDNVLEVYTSQQKKI